VGGLVTWHVAVGALVCVSYTSSVIRPQNPSERLVGSLWQRRHGTTGTTYPVNTDEQDEGCRVANIKSQIKRNRQNEKARLRNKAVKSSLKTAVRRFHEATAAGDVEAAGTHLRAASRKLDKAVSKGVIHKNQAANRKSAISKQYASLSA